LLSTKLIAFLMAEYIVIMAVCAYEGNWPRTLYWLGATALQASIIWGMR
jgi:hypothetical protein